jgi:glutaconate CoA-transferase subunit A
MTATVDKRITLEEAAALLPAGDVVLGLGGFTLYRRPMAFALALLAEHLRSATPRRITLLNFTAGLESDILVGARLIHAVRTCYFGLEAFGLAPSFTEAAGRGELEIIEESEVSLALGLRAALAGVGFMPSLAWQGTDLLKLRPDIKQVSDPYSGEILTAFPALHCDLAAVHALRADPHGNADIGGNWGVDRELCLVADQVVITAEEIVPSLDHAQIMGHAVTAVVEAPQGAWPTSCYPAYALDGAALLEYLERAGTAGRAQLLAEWASQHHIVLPEE